ncbi:histidine kinase, partial [Mesorhizobium sp. M2D.F.Ca.ET.145.01.1.1]
LTISPVRNASGRIVGASKIARDITAARESEQRIRMLMREVNHRVKNQYAVILSMIRETNNRSDNPAEFEAQVRERIMALSRSHDLLVSADWKGATLR